MSTDFECRLCGSSAARRRFAAREMMLGRRTTFEYVECGGCDGLQIATIPHDLELYYPKEYPAHTPADGSQSFSQAIGGQLRWLQRQARHLGLRPLELLLQARNGPLFTPKAIAALGELAPSSRILDVGCGSGALLIDLRYLGFSNVSGVDPYLAASIEYPGGVRIARAPLSDIRGSFDVIMLHHVFEHLVDPRQTLVECRERLSRNGRVLLRFPSVPCEAFDVYGIDWVALDAPRHLQIASRKGVEAAAKAAGLAISSWEQDSEPMQFWASEQYQRDIPLLDPRSYFVDGSTISPERIQQMQMRSDALNREGRGDWSVVVLQTAP